MRKLKVGDTISDMFKGPYEVKKFLIDADGNDFVSLREPGKHTEVKVGLTMLLERFRYHSVLADGTGYWVHATRVVPDTEIALYKQPDPKPGDLIKVAGTWGICARIDDDHITIWVKHMLPDKALEWMTRHYPRRQVTAVHPADKP